MPSLQLGLGTHMPNRVFYSAAARDYFTRLDAAGLRVGTYDKANARLIDRLVANGGNFWPDSGAFCAMAGYLYPGNGANLIPIKDGHDAGTLNAFVTGDWNAVTGLKGDGSTKYVDSNRNNNADGQNDKSTGVYQTLRSTGVSVYLGANVADDGCTNLGNNASLEFFSRLNSRDAIITSTAITDTNQYIGQSRDNSTQITYYFNGLSATGSVASQAPLNENIKIFRRGDSAPRYANARFPFYHIGPNLSGAGELAELDAALTEWQNALAAA